MRPFDYTCRAFVDAPLCCLLLTLRTPRVKRSLLPLTVMWSMCEGGIQEFKMSVRARGFGFERHLPMTFQGHMPPLAGRHLDKGKFSAAI